MEQRRTLAQPGHPWIALALFIVTCLAAGWIGAAFTGPAVQTWYPTLRKPAWTPPAWLFAPVWTTLYIAMAVAAWRIWLQRGRPGAGAALSLFGVQLVLNTLWSILFFGLRQPGWALAEIAVLWTAILLTLLAFRRLDRPAGWLLVPYLAWVTFASTLNFAVWNLNS